MAYILGVSDSVDTIVAGSNVTISPLSGKGNVTVNSSGGGGGGGVTSLAYTTGINGSGSSGAITLSNTGVTSLTAGTGLGLSGSTGAITISNTSPSIVLNAGSNITITNTSTINISANPTFSNSMGFTGITGDNHFSNVVYPFGAADYYPYMYSGSGTNVNNTLGAKQFWATNNPGGGGAVMKYSYTGIKSQQNGTGTTFDFLYWNDAGGYFTLSNVNAITGSISLVNTIVAGSNISISGSSGNVTINAIDAGVATLSLASGGGLYNIGTSTDPILGALVAGIYAGTGIGVISSSGNYTISNTGVTDIVAGTGISISGSTGSVTIDATSTTSPADTVVLTPSINGSWTAVDGDVALLGTPIKIALAAGLNNLATAEVIVCHFSCGPILGQSTAGATNASYFSVKGLISPTTGGTPVATPAYGQYIVDYGATMGGDFTVVFSKVRGEFFADSMFLQLYKMDLPGAGFSSAILPAIAVPNIYLNLYAM